MPDLEEAVRRTRARLVHFDKRGQELAASIEEWRTRDPEPVSMDLSIAEDRMSWEARWVVDDEPFEAWALIFADAAGHLRAALNNALHFIAEQEGADERQLRAVQFPIVADPTKWPGEAQRIAMLPSRVRAALEALQPFQRPEAERPADGLWILSQLNNADKHRIILSSTIHPKSIGHHILVQMEREALGEPPRIELNAEIRNGGLAFRHDTSPERIKHVRLEQTTEFQIAIADDAGVPRGITEILDAMGRYVIIVLEYIFSVWDPPAEDEGRATAGERP